MYESARKQTQSIKNKIVEELEALPDYSKRIFTEFEDEMIKKYYPTKGSKIAKILGKTEHQVIGRATNLGIRRTK